MQACKDVLAPFRLATGQSVELIVLGSQAWELDIKELLDL
jgi:hypothetical protein